MKLLLQMLDKIQMMKVSKVRLKQLNIEIVLKINAQLVQNTTFGLEKKRHLNDQKHFGKYQSTLYGYQ